jgi:hypothetical protein
MEVIQWLNNREICENELLLLLLEITSFGTK